LCQKISNHFLTPQGIKMMLSLTQSLLNDASLGHRLQQREVSRFTPEDIRVAISELVAQDRMDLADALVAAGLSLYPDSEDILAIAALLAEVHGDWSSADSLLDKILYLQGDKATATVWQHKVRVQRCLCDPAGALKASQMGLRMHPADPTLLSEQQLLQDLLDAAQIFAPSPTQQ
jgi:hypothetical protein